MGLNARRLAVSLPADADAANSTGVGCLDAGIRSEGVEALGLIRPVAPAGRTLFS